MNLRRIAGVSIAVVVLAIAATTIGVLVTRGDSGEAQTGILVFDASQAGATATAFESQPEAVAAASQLAGFEVRIPSYLPPKWEVTGINVGPKPPAGGTLRTATVTIRDDSAGATLIEANQPYQEYGGPNGAGTPGPPFAGGQFSSYNTFTTKNYTMISGGRGYTLTLPIATPIDDVEAAKILGSLKVD
jgi:hypothetical protein